MFRTIRLTLAALFAVAFVLGGVGDVASARSNIITADTPCSMSNSMPGSADTKPIAPCKGIKADCVNQMGCIAVTALPAHAVVFESSVHYGAIDYWISASKLDSLDLTPEPLPPRTI